MLNSKKLNKHLWVKALNTACYIVNHVYLHPGTKKSSYELWKGKKPSPSYFHIFASTCYILKYHEYLSKFDSKNDGDSKSHEDVLLSYFMNSKTNRVYNMRTKTIIDSANVIIDDFKYFLEFSIEVENHQVH